MRSAHKTQLPAASSVSRFTTATVNVGEINLIEVTEIGSQLSETHLDWSLDKGWSWNASVTELTSYSYAGTLRTTKRDLWKAREYWPGRVLARPREELATLSLISEALVKRPSMGLGLRIVHGEEVHDYRFDFAIRAAFAIEGGWSTPGPDGARNRIRELRYSATLEGGWLWEPPDTEDSPEEHDSSDTELPTSTSPRA